MLRLSIQQSCLQGLPQAKHGLVTEQNDSQVSERVKTMPCWHIDYFELKELKKKEKQAEANSLTSYLLKARAKIPSLNWKEGKHPCSEPLDQTCSFQFN